MNRFLSRRFFSTLSAFALFLFAANLAAQTDTSAGGLKPTAETSARWYFQTSLFTHHWSSNPQHIKHNLLLNLEYQRADNWVIGAAQFRNSFGQPSQFIYVGKIFRPFDSTPNLYLKLTGGAVHGYKGEFRDKIPFNGSGIAPAILPSIGYDFYGRRLATELVVFGTSGLMWTVGARF